MVEPAAFRDEITQAAKVIDNAMHQIHVGNSYMAGVFDLSMGDGDFIGIAFTCPATNTKVLHMVCLYNSKASAHMELIEIPETLTGGTAVTPLNRDRNSSNASLIADMKTYKSDDADVITAGSGLIVTFDYTWVDKKEGTRARPLLEIILKPGLVYAVRVETDEASNAAQLGLGWFEHRSIDT